MPSTSKHQFHLPDDAEEQAINTGIAQDADTMEISDAQFAQMRPVKLGRPYAQQTKERITIRLSADVLAAFRATGTGWQTRVDAALKDWLAMHH